MRSPPLALSAPCLCSFFFLQAEDGIRDVAVTGVQTCALPISNYVMLLLGQPMHAYDLDRLAGPALDVRPAREGEHLRTLDGEERVFDSDAVLVCDAADRKSTRLNSSHGYISYAVFCLKKKRGECAGPHQKNTLAHHVDPQCP